jgi:P27 family predicted phage terminase small subunit
MSPTLKLAMGNPGKRRLPPPPPRPVGPLVKPDHLAGEAGQEWARVVASMPSGHFGSADAPMLAIHAQTWAHYRAAQRMLAADGLMVDGSRGQPTPHPALAMSVRLTGLLIQLADRLGLSPAARSRLEAPPEPPADKFEGLLGGEHSTRMEDMNDE